MATARLAVGRDRPGSGDSLPLASELWSRSSPRSGSTCLPAHTLGLALVALAVACLRVRLGGRRDGLLSVVSGAVVAQPVLHATAKPSLS